VSFVGELGRRNVIRVSIAYALVAWLVIQVADIVLEAIGAPDWVMQTLMLVLVLGFVIAAIFAWAYEVTPDGIKRESEVDRSTSITRVTGRKLDRVIIGLLVAALVYFVWESRFAERSPEVEPVAAVEAAPEAEIIQTPPAELSIAVLPFDNRSNREEDEFFTEGMHDDLLTTLAKIGSMKVISRTSVMEYRDTTKKIPEIARELGVANVLEGGVQRAGNQVRINVQLIDAETDEHLWAEIYDRELTAENLFAIQSEISKAIAEALHATLSPEEADRIDRMPTKSLDALDHYLRGRKFMATRAVDDLERATQEFLKAVELDPGFALAWVGVADSHNLLKTYKGLAEGVFENVRDDAINKALDIDPKLGEAYTSLGSLLSDRGDLVAAEEAWKTAIRYSPNYATAHHWLANMLRWNPARMPEAIAYAQRAVELDPNSAIILGNLANAYFAIGDMANARRYFEQQIEAHPDFARGYEGFADVLAAQGDLVGAVESQRKALELDPDSIGETADLVFLYARMGAFEEAEAVHRSMQERFPGRTLTLSMGPAIDLARGEKGGLREAMSAALEAELSAYGAFIVATTAALGGEFDLAYQAAERIYPGGMDNPEITPEFNSLWLGVMCELSWVLLETKGNEAFGQELLEASIELYEAGFHEDVRLTEQYNWSLCYMLAGQHDKALDVLETELGNHLTGNWPWYLQAPPFDAVRENPRFVALWAEFERRMAEQRDELRRRDKAQRGFEF
jgi:TolB-like protein/Tfp pilus assembly protein PilF